MNEQFSATNDHAQAFSDSSNDHAAASHDDMSMDIDAGPRGGSSGGSSDEPSSSRSKPSKSVKGKPRSRGGKGRKKKTTTAATAPAAETPSESIESKSTDAAAAPVEAVPPEVIATIEAIVDSEGESAGAKARHAPEIEVDAEPVIDDGKNRQLIINYVPGEECRVAVVVDGKLEEFHSERFEQMSRVGNIYVGRVMNVEPAIQAAFIDFGIALNGFLHSSDLHPRYFPGEDGDKTERVGKKTPRRERPPLQECLKRGQEIIVQVLKEGVGSKGPSLTSYLSVPGRYLVMMPGMDNVGVSRKVEDEETRAKTRAILDQLELPDGFGFILRTAGLDKSKSELKRDLGYLMRLQQDMERRRMNGSKPRLLYSESDLLLRSLRDLMTAGTTQVVIDSEVGMQRAARFIQLVSPKATAKLTHYTGRTPIYHAFGIEPQIRTMYSREVPLPSGGRLVIDETEALVAIDVNSGKHRDASDSETNALKTNLEAIEEISRQLRLRDMGGIVVNDLIDMRYSRHRDEVQNKFTKLLERDRARTTLLPISDFGTLEMTRQRVRGSHESQHFHACPACHGRGLVQKPDSVTADALRELATLMDCEKVAKVEMVVHPRVAAELLSSRRKAVARLERQFGKTLAVRLSDAVQPDRVSFYAYDEQGADIEIDRLPKFKLRDELMRQWVSDQALPEDEQEEHFELPEPEAQQELAEFEQDSALAGGPVDTTAANFTLQTGGRKRGGRGRGRGGSASPQGQPPQQSRPPVPRPPGPPIVTQSQNQPRPPQQGAQQGGQQTSHQGNQHGGRGGQRGQQGFGNQPRPPQGNQQQGRQGPPPQQQHQQQPPQRMARPMVPNAGPAVTPPPGSLAAMFRASSSGPANGPNSGGADASSPGIPADNFNAGNGPDGFDGELSAPGTDPQGSMGADGQMNQPVQLGPDGLPLPRRRRRRRGGRGRGGQGRGGQDGGQGFAGPADGPIPGAIITTTNAHSGPIGWPPPAKVAPIDPSEIIDDRPPAPGFGGGHQSAPTQGSFVAMNQVGNEFANDNSGEGADDAGPDGQDQNQAQGPDGEGGRRRRRRRRGRGGRGGGGGDGQGGQSGPIQSDLGAQGGSPGQGGQGSFVSRPPQQNQQHHQQPQQPRGNPQPNQNQNHGPREQHNRNQGRPPQQQQQPNQSQNRPPQQPYSAPPARPPIAPTPGAPASGGPANAGSTPPMPQPKRTLYGAFRRLKPGQAPKGGRDD